MVSCKTPIARISILTLICYIIIIIIRLDARLEKLKITIRMGLLQKTALLGTAKILRKVLESLRRRNNPRDPWPLAMAYSFGVITFIIIIIIIIINNDNDDNSIDFKLIIFMKGFEK